MGMLIRQLTDQHDELNLRKVRKSCIKFEVHYKIEMLSAEASARHFADY